MPAPKPIALAITAILRGFPADAADATAAADVSAAAGGGLEEITVTAAKRSEDLQSVPISIQALSGKILGDMNVQHFDDYARQLTTVNFQQTEPGHANITMRGIASDSGGNPSGSLPTESVLGRTARLCQQGQQLRRWPPCSSPIKLDKEEQS